MQYKVKSGFYLHKDDQCFEPGTLVELTESEAEFYAAQVEQVAKTKSKTSTTDS
jgi:hypothetical protein